jgi:PAS domain S-box-containing protein
MNDFITVGIALAAAGGLVILGVITAARFVSRRREQQLDNGDPIMPVNLASADEAVLVARAGGQVTFANEAAREWFTLNGGEPDLWALAQRAAPASYFLELFAAEGRASFYLDEQPVEATSHRVSVGDSTQFVVVMRREDPLPALDPEERGSAKALQFMSDAAQAIYASLDLAPTLDAALAAARRLVPHDAAQICLWDGEGEVLRPTRRTGPAAYVAATHQEGEVYRREEDYAGWIAHRRQPLLIKDTRRRTVSESPTTPEQPPSRSYLGIPLVAQNRFIGTLELYGSAPGAFDEEDRDLLTLLARHIATAVENARIYGIQAERVEELSGLRQIAEAISVLQQPRQLYAQLGKRIAALMGTEMAGILLYDRDRERLIAQRPFNGMTEAVAARYMIPLGKGSPARGIWEDVTYWFCNDVESDALIHDLGLNELAEMAGVNTTAMATMTVGDERIGVLQVFDRQDGAPFSMADIHTLQAYANQAAIVVESARLYAEEQSRVAELQGLQQIVQTMSAFTNPEELYTRLTERIADLMGVRFCGILLYEPEDKKLTAQHPFYGLKEEIVEQYTLPVSRRGLVREVWRERELFVSNRVFTDDAIDRMELRDVARLAGFQTMMLAPLSAGGRRFGMLQVANKEDNTDFDESDQRLLTIFAGQAAALIENARLYQDTDATLRQRAAELRSVSRVSRELNATLELERILEVIAAEAQRAEGVRWGSVVMFDWDEARRDILATMRFGTSFGEDTRALERDCAEGDETLVVDDFDKAARYPTPAPGVRSALLVPVQFEGRVVGVIGLYSDVPRGIGPSAAEFAQALSSQATIAVTNATRHAEQVERSELLQRRAEQMTQIFELGRAFRSDQSIEGNLESVARAIAESTGFETVLIGVRGQEGRALRLMAGSGIERERLDQMIADTLDWPSVRHTIGGEDHPGGVYLIRGDEGHRLTTALGLPKHHYTPPPGGDDSRRWQEGDVLIGQLRSSGDELIGALIITDPSNGMMPDDEAIELLEIFANQAAMVVENSRLYQSVEERAEQLTASLRDLEKSYQELDTLSQEMIRKDVELSQANDLLNTRAARLMALHRVVESLDTTRQPEAVLEAIAQSVVEEMDVDQCVIAVAREDDPAALELAAAAGRLPDTLDESALLGDASPLTAVYAAKSAQIYAPGGRGGTDAARLAETIGANTYVALPLAVESHGGVILLGSTQLGAGFGEDDRDFFVVLASQVVVEVENARLYHAVEREAALAATDRDRLQQLHVITTALQQTRGLEARLNIVARGLRSVGWRKVAVMLLDKDKTTVSHVVFAGYDNEAAEAHARRELLPGEFWGRRFEDEDFLSTGLGASYYLTHDHPWVVEHLDDVSGAKARAALPAGAWHPNDQVYIPMYAGTEVIGVVNLRDPASGRQPTVADLRPIELFVQQASSALENTRLYQETLELQSFTEAVLESIQQGIVVMDAEGQVESVNAFLRDEYEWGGRVVGRQLSEAVPALRELDLAENIDTVVRDGMPIERTGIQMPVAGELRHLNLYLYPRFGEEHSVNGVVMLLEDVTRRARLEADIAQRGQQLAALNEASRGITSTLSLGEVVEIALDEAHTVLPFNHLEIWLREQTDTEHLRLAGARGEGESGDAERPAVAIATIPQFDQIARDNLPLITDDRPPAVAEGGAGDARAHLRSWMGVPMIGGGAMLGIMVFERAEAHAYVPADAQIASAFANQVAVALENARLFEEAADRATELHSRSQRLALLNRVSATLGRSLDQNSILQSTIDQLREALDAPQGSVYLFDYEHAVGTLVIQSPSNPDGSVPDVEIGLDDNPAIARLLKTKMPLPIKDIETDPLAADIRYALVQRSVQSTLLIPLLVGNAMIGVLSVDEVESQREFEPEQVELAQTITNQAAVSVQNAQLFEETVNRQRELATLSDAGRALASSLDLDTVARNAVQYLVRSLDVSGGAVSLLVPGGQTLAWLFEQRDGGEPSPPSPDEARFRLGAYPNITRILSGDEPIAVSASSRSLTTAEADWLHAREAASVMLVPLVTRDETIGLAALWDGDPARRFSQREARLARALAASIATSMENARLHVETEGRLEELTALNELSRALTQVISIEDLYHLLPDWLRRVVGAHSLTIALRDAETGRLAFPLVIRGDQRVQPGPESFNEALYNHVIDGQESLLISRGVETELRRRGLEPVEAGLKSLLVVPFASGKTAGALAVKDFEQEGAFDEANLRILNPIATQVAVSIENARLYAELEQRLSETTTLQEVSRVVNSALELEAIFNRVVGQLAQAFNYPLIGLYTLDGDRLRLEAQHGYSDALIERMTEVPADRGLLGKAAAGEPLLARSTETGSYLPFGPQVGSAVAVPIIADEDVLGVLTIASGQERMLGDNDLDLLRTFAGQVATAMTNARLYEQVVTLSEELEQRVEDRTRELREERDRIDTLYRIAVELTASLDLDMVLNRALELVGEAVGADTGALFLIDPQSDLLIHRASMSYEKPLPPGGRQVQIHQHEGLAGWVMDNRQSLVLDNVQEDPRWVDLPGSETRRSLLGAPLIANNEVLGCMFFNSDLEGAFSHEQLRLVEAAANQVAASINNAELYRLIRDQAERLGVMLRSQQTEAAKSQAILESVADGVMVTDPAGEVILFNAAAERTLGLHRHEALGRSTAEISGLVPGASQWAAILQRWQDDPSAIEGSFVSEQLEFDERVVSVHVSPVRHGSEYIGLVSVFRDITREVMADRIKSEFVARVSHELRTPMTSIKGYADLLLLGAAGEVTSEQRRFLETVKSNADRLSLLVNDLLDISRIEQGQIDLDIEAVELEAIVGDVLAAFRGRMQQEGRDLLIQAVLPDHVPLIEADYDRVVQILTNLISNAYQYTPDEGRVTLRVMPGEDGVQIDVIDTGVGIAQDSQDRIFERFYRDESNPVVFEAAGTGLGLSIVKQLVELHNGRVWFDSAEGVGSTFSVWLPAKFRAAPGTERIRGSVTTTTS